MSGQEENILGRKVFFLYPHSVLKDQLMELIFQAGYEVYVLHDHAKAKSLVRRYPGSMLFINIDEKIRDTSWTEYVGALMREAEEYGTRVGVLSYNDDPALAKRYLMELSVPCGFIRLRLSLADSAKILMSVLEANEARGKRKFVRLTIPDDLVVSFNVKIDRSFANGRIRDLSIAGMACAFDGQAPFRPGEVLSDIQLNLKGGIVHTSGKIVGVRGGAEAPLYVITFTAKDAGESRRKLHAFIYATLQGKIDREMARL